jgi:hypothetical protein
VDELEHFQPTPGYMRLLKESVLRVWHDREASVKNEVMSAEHRAKAIQQKLDRLDDAFIYKESIDLSTYERQRDRLREELTLIEIDRHGSRVEEFDVEGVLNFAERVLPRASDLWIQSSLEQRQRLQRLFFPRRRGVQRKSLRSNHRNVFSLRVLTAPCWVERKCGGPDLSQMEPDDRLAEGLDEFRIAA